MRENAENQHFPSAQQCSPLSVCQCEVALRAVEVYGPDRNVERMCNLP
jgi:hypothetical protein